MSFDKIIANPPFDKNLHLKILREAMKHIEKEGGEIVSLEPITEVKRKLLFNDECKLLPDNFEITDVYDVEESADLFNIEIRHPLGIWHLSKNIITDWKKLENTIIEYKPIVDKIRSKIGNNPLSLHITKKPTGKYFLKLCDGVSTYCHAKVTVSTYLYTSANFKTATEGTNKGHLVYLNFDNAEEQRNAWQALTTKFMKFVSKYATMCSPRYDQIFTLDWSRSWTDADLYEYFNLTPEKIKIIEEEMK
jgi:hypothetical protein